MSVFVRRLVDRWRRARSLGIGDVTLAGAILWGLGLFLLFTAWTFPVTRVPGAFFGDEATYFGMTVSLANAMDLKWERSDYDEIVRHFPRGPEGLVLMEKGDGRYFYSKPFAYSLAAAPFYKVFGPRGFIILNAALFFGLVAIGFRYLKEHAPTGTALAFSVLFFGASAAYPYLFWISPEIFLLFLWTAATFLWLGARDRSTFPFLDPSPRWLAAAGCLMGLAGSIKPPSLILAAPAFIMVVAKRQARGAAALGFSLAAVLGGVLAGQFALTGEISPYHAPMRYGFNAATGYPDVEGNLARDREVSSWHQVGVFSRFELNPRTFLCNLAYFLVGRHTGMMVYFPAAVVAVALFARGRMFSLERWLILGSLGAYAVFLLLYLPGNYFGGSTFVGNRYFLPAYGLFLFLPGACLPRGSLAAILGAAGLFLGGVIVFPLRPAAAPPLNAQVHARDWVHGKLPFESTAVQIDGADRFRYWDSKLVRFLDSDAEVRAQDFVMPVPSVQEILIGSLEPVSRITFTTDVRAPGVRVEARALTRRARFESAEGRVAGFMNLRPAAPFCRHQYYGFLGGEIDPHVEGRKLLWYRVRLKTSWLPGAGPRGDATAVLRFLGEARQLEQDFYRVECAVVQAPDVMVPGDTAWVRLNVTNQSPWPWSSDGPSPVMGGYHWKDERGQNIVFEGLRTPLPGPIAAGQTRQIWIEVRPPDQPGRYLLAPDLLSEGVAWFSAGRGKLCPDVPVQVPERRRHGCPLSPLDLSGGLRGQPTDRRGKR